MLIKALGTARNFLKWRVDLDADLRRGLCYNPRGEHAAMEARPHQITSDNCMADKDATFETECTAIFYTGYDYTLDVFGFTSGPVEWDGVSPMFFTLWDFSKARSASELMTSSASALTSCVLVSETTGGGKWTLTELES
eukprot:gene7690-853_t